ncbi:claudin-7-like isoform X3 [Alosa sapidissima]|uniref:claudin-7-like isoform X3 n=1 Tax=Alosa sapidissima TaxID=34773 RepID=UPI001C09EEA8|nr:claudin-7-like isoform X3 [Alosa sapidissima]
MCVDIQVTRAIMIISIILSACGLAVVVLGMKYTLCLDKDKHVKNKVAFVGGILITVAGVCSLGIVSWYAHAVVNTQKPRPFLGKCLFLGWGGALLSITGGVLLSCCGLSQSTPRRSYTSPHSVQLASSKVYV